jgi:hypothetical protein
MLRLLEAVGAVRSRFATLALWAAFLVAGSAMAQNDAQSPASPRWMYELRAGRYYPDLDRFNVFYGNDNEAYYGLAASFRPNEWFEVGGEYGHMHANGVGLLTVSQMLGGSVEYRLNPAQIFANFIYQRSSAQRVVPYVGLGLVVARYEQEVNLQGTSSGRTDLGHSVRLGVRFLVASRPRAAQSGRTGGSRWRSFVFIEGQELSAKADSIELGGRAYSLGFRMEFELD